MNLYLYQLTFHDNLFYETRTLGRLYETGRLLHNIALCYALGLAQTSYFHADDVPHYAEELANLNDRNIYITPAAGVDIRYVIHTFKLGDERSSVMMERNNANIPTYGRAKEIGVDSRFRFGILAASELTIPRWIRMGLWLSKARVEPLEQVALHETQPREREKRLSLLPLNPADLPSTATLRLFDLVSIRPSSLVENAEIEATDWWVGQLKNGKEIAFPVGLQHRVEVAVGKR
ncbi:MAG: type I-D CRISPR-associated protein Cas5/Csc1 [Anaerolineae bacterium]|nr:type I-D CRISPR-associated protein Cas5/Csc1 [Anaerolineae bacterium]